MVSRRGVLAVLTSLALVIETLVVRHCELAIVFITPRVILLAEAAQGAVMTPQPLIERRTCGPDGDDALVPWRKR